MTPNTQQEKILKAFREKWCHPCENGDKLDVNIFHSTHSDPEYNFELWLSTALQEVEEKAREETIEEIGEAIICEYKSFNYDDGDGSYAIQAIKKLKNNSNECQFIHCQHNPNWCTQAVGHKEKCIEQLSKGDHIADAHTMVEGKKE